MNNYYTYAYLREDRTPYYIGKGSGNRAYRRSKKDIKPPKDRSRIIFLKQNLTEEKAFQHEIYMISIFGRKDLGTGILHNKTDGGDGSSGLIHNEETKGKISKANSGRIVSEKTKRKIGEKSKGRIHSEKTRKKMSELGKCRTHSEKSKVKMSEQSKGRNNPLYGKKWWNDGCGNVKISAECPGKNWYAGRGKEHKVKSSLSNKGKKWWNDGCGNSKRSIECPGENWVAGRPKKE